MIIQDLIDCLPTSGGKVTVPAGNFSAQPPLVMRSGVIIEGQGPLSTILPALKIGAGEARPEGLVLRDLAVDAIATPNSYEIDWRNVSTCQINNVYARGGTYGLVLDYVAYYALVTSFFVDASVCAVEAYGGANQNTFIGGKWAAPLGLNVTGSNGITVVATSIEGANAVNFVQGVDPVNSVKFVNVRQERSGAHPFGPVWLNN